MRMVHSSSSIIMCLERTYDITKIDKTKSLVSNMGKSIGAETHRHLIFVK